MPFFFFGAKRIPLIIFVCFFFALSALGIAATPSALERPVSAGYSPLTFHQLSHKSGYIFAGNVTAIRRVMSAPNTLATIRITFRVTQAIRGVVRGESLTIREWAGVWEFGGRYRVGERVLVFLYPASRLGLTSTVGGWQGRFVQDGEGLILLNRWHASTFPAIQGAWKAGRLRAGVEEFERAIKQTDGE